MKRYFLVMALFVVFLLAACDSGEDEGAPNMTGEAEGQETTAQDPIPLPDPTEAASGAPTTAGTFDKMALWVDGPHLRGANIWQAVVIPDLDGLEFKGPGPVGPPFTQEDLNQLAALGANYVSISGPGLFTEKPPYVVDPGVEAHLDNLLAMIEQADMFAVIGFRTGPGRSEFNLCCSGDLYFREYFNDIVWEDQAAQDAWVEMWRYTADRYKDNPIVAGYKLMVEPNPSGIFFGIFDPDEFYDQYAGTLYDWNQFYPHIVDGIREVDAETPILVGGMGWSGVEWLNTIKPVDDPRMVYIVHQYEPQDDYTHQTPRGRTSYPGELDLDYDGEDDPFDRAWLDEFLSPIDEFKARYGAPVAVDEYGVSRWVPGAAAYMNDEMDLFEQRGLNQALWEWQTSWPPFREDTNDMHYPLGPDPDNLEDVPNELMDVIASYWARNTIRPSNFETEVETETETEIRSSLPALEDVRHWLYLINVNLEQEVVDQIAASEHDMVVLDFIPSEENNTDYPMAEVIAQLHQAEHPKLVIAYIDIGEAEEYRTYWQKGWGIGNPEWIIAGDPDGWEGNFPVAYWYDEWQDIWLDEETGLMQAIVGAGFDGIYLDWVEAYSDETVAAFAAEDNVDPIQEMIWFVGDIAEFGWLRNENFIVIGQNAAELAQNDDYVDIVDAIAQEQVWFDGGADNEPPGDCPLPRAEDDIDTDAYYDSLSRPCRRQYDDFPESTLHVSSEYYLNDLTLAQSKGLAIFTVDYALEPKNVIWVYETSRGLGFVPFVGNRALDQFVAP